MGKLCLILMQVVISKLRIKELGIEKINVTRELVKNELNVLLTRGVHGLYIYVVDNQLLQALLSAAGSTHILKENDGLYGCGIGLN